MANKDLFKQAIAEAKSVREAAIANAKEALEESLTPHLKDMLAAKLQEMDDSKNEEAENVNEEEVEEGMHDKKKDEGMHDKKKDEAKHDKKDESIEESEEISEEETIEEAPKDKEIEEDLAEVDADVAEVEANEAEDDSEESEDEAEDHDAPEGDEDVSNLTVDQFKDLIRDIIAQEVGDGVEGPADMDAGDIEGMGDEPAIDEPVDGMEAEDEEEIDLDELLAELEATAEVNEAPKDDEKNEAPKKEMDEAHDDKEKNEAPKKKMEEAPKKEKVNEEVEETNDELSQALETIETLKKELNEVNILNSKLLYVNKIFKSNDLSESQKVNIIAAFDKAETVKEVKLVYETVSDSVVSKKEANNTIKESKTKLGMASKATGTTASKPEVINEVSDTVRRMQKLAGIIK